MYIFWDGDWDTPEIEISDSAQGLSKLGELLVNVSEDFIIYADQEKNEFYPENLEAASIRLGQSEDANYLDLLTFFISENKLVIKGSKLAFYNFGSSLIGFDENSQKDVHFHLDYFEGYDILAPTTCSIIVVCRGQVI